MSVSTENKVYGKILLVTLDTKTLICNNLSMCCFGNIIISSTINKNQTNYKDLLLTKRQL